MLTGFGRSHARLVAIAFLAAPVPAVAQVRASRTAMVKSDAQVAVTAALVMPDLTVRPLPLLPLELIGVSDTLSRFSFRTGLDGTAAQAVPQGRWRLRSVQPTHLADSTFRWDFVIDVGPSGTRVEVTNANAIAGARVPAATTPLVATQGQRQTTPEREVFERVKRGVVRVEAGLGHGSGFFIDVNQSLLVVTNDHVVADAAQASVYVDSATRVPANVLVRDREADLAILRLPAGRCSACPRLPLARSSADVPLVMAGERVIAVGFPLSQELTITSGIVSSVREGAIISDVNINPGNSGGPMLNLAGEVVAVNTFGDFASHAGPGISGAIAIHRLRPLLDKVPAALVSATEPSDKALAPMPTGAYPAALLKSTSDAADPRTYRGLQRRSAGKFWVTITTPVMYKVAQRLAEAEVAGDRRKREQRAGVASDERYSELKQVRDWEQYVGSYTAPVVTVSIEPKIGETGWSTFGRVLETMSYGTPVSAAKYKFQGDVRGARFFRNGVEVDPLRGGHAPQAVRHEDRWVQLKDVADMGYYVLAPEVFQPDSSGAPPRNTIVVQDLKNPNHLSHVEFYDETSARVWNDFVPYIRLTKASPTIHYSDPTRRSPKVLLNCNPTTAACDIHR